MRTPAILISAVVIAAVVLSLPVHFLSARAEGESAEEAAAGEHTSPLLRPRIDFVRTVDFYLIGGEFVTGKLIEEDKGKLVVERLADGRIEVVTYARKDIEPRSIRTSTTPEYKFYDKLGDYFAGRTWDFKDDPDDFIRAIRAYKRARAIAEQNERRQAEIDEIEEKTERLIADRQRWKEEVSNRAELKKLEFEATFVERLKGIENNISRNTEILDEALARFDAFAKQTKTSLDGTQKSLGKLSDNVAKQLKVLDERITNNRLLIKDIERRWPYLRYR